VFRGRSGQCGRCGRRRGGGRAGAGGGEKTTDSVDGEDEMNIMMELRQARSAKVDEMKAMTTAAEVENRDFTADETVKWDGLMTEVDGLDKRMSRLEALETAQEAAPVTTQTVKRSINYNKKTR